MLPSQSARPASARSHMYRRTRMRKAPFIIVPVVAFTVVFGVMKLWPGSKRESIESANAAANQPDAENSQAAQPPRVEPKPVVQQPVKSDAGAEKISMGTPPPPTRGKPAAENRQEAVSTAPPPPASSVPPANTPAKSETTLLAAAPAATPLPDSPATATPAGDSATGRNSQRMTAGLDLLARNKPVEARKMLTDALLHEKLSPADADRIRQTLTTLNQKLVFGPDVVPGDTLARTYTVESGDVLVKLPRKLGLKTDYRFISRVNNLPSDSLRVGQRLKIVSGPFHAVIIKNEFRMDVFAGDWDQRVFVCSFPVGLGEYGATPEGVFAVRPNSKLIDPEWVNPRTGEKFEAGDPKNPIGDRWIGLIGASENIRDLTGYGIHGTIDPESIGQQKSMGCVRMKADDVAIMYELLLENVSRIEIHGADYP